MPVTVRDVLQLECLSKARVVAGERGLDHGPDARWITVSPAGSRIMIVLEKAEQDHEKALVGRSDGTPVLVLSTDDIHATYERLQERGVQFLEEPVRYPWGGIGARFLDQDGSPIFLQQESGGS